MARCIAHGTISGPWRLYNRIILYGIIIRLYTQPPGDRHEFHRCPFGRHAWTHTRTIAPGLGLRPSGDDAARTRTDPEAQLADRVPREPDPGGRRLRDLRARLRQRDRAA